MRRKTQRRWRRAHVDARRDAADVDYISRVFCLPDRNRNSSLIFPLFSPCCRAQLELMYPLRPGIPYEKTPPKNTHICFFFRQKKAALACVFVFSQCVFMHTCGSKGQVKHFFFCKNKLAMPNTAAPDGSPCTPGCEWTLAAVLHHSFSFAESPFVVIVMQLTMKLKSTHPLFLQ